MSEVRVFRKLGIVLLTSLVVAAIGCDEKHPDVVATPPPVVLVSRPVSGKVTDTQDFTARTQAVQSVDIKARVTGYLTKISFTDGDEVNEGSVLFQIDDRPYKATLDQSKAAVEFAVAALVKAQAYYDIGLAVKKQSPGAISEQELTNRLGSRDESIANIAKAKAALASAQLNYDWCTVTAPINGKANRHLVDVGNLVTQNVTTLTNIVSLKPIWAYFDVDENTMLTFQQLVAEGKVEALSKTVVPVEMALATSTGNPFKGTIDFVSNQ